MATNIGPRIGIDGESEYRSALNNIIQQQKTLSSEMEKTAAVFAKDADAKKKNAAQIEILNKQIAVQKDRVSEISKMYEKSVEKNGESATATLKWKQALAEAETELAKLENQLDQMDGPKKLADQMKEAGESIKTISSKMESVGKTMTKTVTAPIVGAGVAALKAFEEIDKGTDTIIKKTGASGEALKGMETSMKNLATQIPTSFESAGEAIGEVNTRFGVTGQELEDLSAQFLKFAELNGTDVSSSIDSVQKMMASFGLETKDASAVLDTLNKVGQDTGIGVDKLAQSLVTNGSALRELGMNAADSAVLLGQLEKSGVDTSAVMTGLSKVQKTAMEDGVTMTEALTQAVNSSGDAIDIFGAKAGPKLYEAFQSGILSLDMFTGGVNSLQDSIGSVSSTFDETLDPMDKWQTTLNQLTIAGAELGNAIGPMLVPAIQGLADAAKAAGEWFGSLDEGEQKTIITAAGLVAAAGPVITVLSGVGSTIGTVLTIGGSLVTGIGTVIGILGGPLTLAIGAAIASGVLLWQNWDKVREFAGTLATGIGNKWDEIKNKTSTIWDSVKTKITNTINGARDAVQNGISRIKSIMNFQWSLPHLKLPHFSISGGFSLNPPSVPHFSISWYKKAYQNAIEFKHPTVLATAGGVKGFGDGSGSEIVYGKNALLNDISTAVKAAGGGNRNEITFNVTIVSRDDMDQQGLAEYTADLINDRLMQIEEVFA